MRKAAFVMLAIMAVAVMGMVAEKKPEPKAKPTVDPTSAALKAVRNVALARDLAAYGLERNLPEALLVAAQILIDTPVAELEVKKEEEPLRGEPTTTPTTKPVKKGAPQPFLDVAKLLGAAKKLAAGNEVLLAFIKLIEDRVPDATRGPLGGPQVARIRVNPQSADVLRIAFVGGEQACVSLSGDHDTDLDLYVYDQNGLLVAQDTDSGDDCIVMFRPLWTGPFTIKVVNRGGVYNEYTIIAR